MMYREYSIKKNQSNDQQSGQQNSQKTKKQFSLKSTEFKIETEGSDQIMQSDLIFEIKNQVPVNTPNSQDKFSFDKQKSSQNENENENLELISQQSLTDDTLDTQIKLEKTLSSGKKQLKIPTKQFAVLNDQFVIDESEQSNEQSRKNSVTNNQGDASNSKITFNSYQKFIEKNQSKKKFYEEKDEPIDKQLVQEITPSVDMNWGSQIIKSNDNSRKQSLNVILESKQQESSNTNFQNKTQNSQEQNEIIDLKEDYVIQKIKKITKNDKNNQTIKKVIHEKVLIQNDKNQNIDFKIEQNDKNYKNHVNIDQNDKNLKNIVNIDQNKINQKKDVKIEQNNKNQKNDVKIEQNDKNQKDDVKIEKNDEVIKIVKNNEKIENDDKINQQNDRTKYNIQEKKNEEILMNIQSINNQNKQYQGSLGLVQISTDGFIPVKNPISHQNIPNRKASSDIQQNNLFNLLTSSNNELLQQSVINKKDSTIQQQEKFINIEQLKKDENEAPPKLEVQDRKSSVKLYNDGKIQVSSTSLMLMVVESRRKYVASIDYSQINPDFEFFIKRNSNVEVFPINQVKKQSYDYNQNQNQNQMNQTILRNSGIQKSNILPQQQIMTGIQRQELDELQIKLKMNSNIWLQTQNTASNSDQNKQDQNVIMSALNKLSPDNLNNLTKEIQIIAMKNENLQKFFVDKLFKKAQWEAKYASTYAQLCSNLIKENQNEFMKNLIIDKVKQISDSELQENIAILKEDIDKEEALKDQHLKKKRNLGNVNFFGELFLIQILDQQRMQRISAQIINSFLNFFNYHQNNQTSVIGHENLLDSLILMYEKIGQQIEKEQKNLNKSFNQKNVIDQINSSLSEKTSLVEIEYASAENVFEFLQIVHDLNISSRMKFLIKNLQNRKLDNWKESIASTKGPVKLSELQEEHYKQLEEIELRGNNYEKKLRNNQNNRGGYKQNNNSYSNQKNKQYQQYQQYQQQQQNVREESEIESLIKELLPKYGEIYESNDIKPILRILSGSETKLFIKVLLNNFFQFKKNLVNKYLGIFVKLFEENHIQSEQFLSVYNQFIVMEGWQLYQDHPELNTYLAEIIISYIELSPINLTDITIDLNGGEKEFDPDIQDGVLEFYLDFLDRIKCVFMKKGIQQRYKNDLLQMIAQIKQKFVIDGSETSESQLTQIFEENGVTSLYKQFKNL